MTRRSADIPTTASTARRWWRPGRRVAVAGSVAVLLVGMASGAAYGYFTAGGSGTGSASVGTLDQVTLATAGTPSSPLLPGDAGDVTLQVTNPNPVAVSLVGVALQTGGSITPDAGHAGCATTDSNPVVTLTVPSGDLPVQIAAGATVAVDLATAAHMDVAATQSCQGASFTVPVTLTVHNS